MKKISQLSFLMFLLIAVSSCEDELDKFTQFTVKDSSEVVVPATTLILDAPLTLPTPNIEVNLNEQFENNNSRKDLIESAKLTKMTLILNSPDNGSFDFLNKVELFIDVEGKDRILLASVSDIPENGLKSVSMVVSEAELREYINKDSYTVNGTVSVDKTIESEYTIEIASEFFIDAKIFGI